MYMVTQIPWFLPLNSRVSHIQQLFCSMTAVVVSEPVRMRKGGRGRQQRGERDGGDVCEQSCAACQVRERSSEAVGDAG